MEKISLKELIQILLKKKLLILIVTLMFVVVGGVFSLVIPRHYTSTLMLRVNPLSFNSGVSGEGNLGAMLDAFNSTLPQADLATYQELITNSVVLGRTITALNLKDDSGNPMAESTLVKMITVESIIGTNLLKVSVRSKDAQLATAIADTVGNVFIEFISEINREVAEVASKAIEANLIIEAEKLDEEAQKLRDYLATSPNIDAIKGEIQVLIQQISNYKSSLINVQRDIVVAENSLASIIADWNPDRAVIGAELNLNTSGGSHEITLNTDNENTLRDALLTIETTDLNTQLIKNYESEKAITESIVELEARLTDLQTLLANENFRYNAIMKDYNLAEQTYSAYQIKYKEAIVASTADIGAATVQIPSRSTSPTESEGTSKVIVIAIATMLGFMSAIFVAFFMEYWKTADDYKSTVA